MAKKEIKSINLLPEFLKTDKNNKFLSSTIDQLIQQPQLERLSGYVGSKLTPNYNSTSDVYIAETSLLREAYQLNPSLVVRDVENNITDIVSFDDLVNAINFNGGLTDNLSRLFDSNTHSFNPNIDWDKFTNYQEYYWLTTGPDTVVITGQQRNSTSTYVVRDNDIGTSFIFNPNGIEEDPLITLYRGNTYNFDVNSRHKFYIKTTPTVGQTDLYNSNVTNNGISTGTLSIRIDEFTPSTLFYVSGDNLEAQGQFSIKTIEQDSFLNVETEILGKKNYTSGNGVLLSNGMKIRFGGEVFPESYQNKEFFVEGVGVEIKLVDYNLLLDSTGLSSLYNDNFDSSNFDSFPFDNFKRLPIDPEYITINRASQDINPWSRYNRWVHGNVIRASAIANGKEPVYPNDKRARRPIIEFNPNIKLYNFGTIGIKNVDLIDNSTTDAFSFVEGTAGYYVDGVLLEQGHRVIFNADTDSFVRGKIYEVNYIIIDNKLRLELNPTFDHEPQEYSSISVSLGNEYEGTSWWFNGDKWQFAQQKLGLNQPPLFDLFDSNGISYSNTTYYSSDFRGNKIFGYDIGQGANDTVLGFPLKYKNTSGVGSYLFKNYFVTDQISISRGFQEIETIPSVATFFKITTGYGVIYSNIWTESKINAMPILQFQALAESTSTIEINSIDIKNVNTIGINVIRNNKKVEETLYSVELRNKKYYVDFSFELSVNDLILLKIYTNAGNSNLGYYDIPLSLTNNPLNGNIESFTLSEITDHVETVVEKSLDFRGSFPGSSNLRDLGNLYSNGTRLISNAEPISFAAMFIGRKEHSLITAITKANDDYNQFKLSLLQKISEVDGQLLPSDALDIVLKEINKDKDTLSAYYYSDMVGYTTDKIVRSWTVTDIRNKIYPLNSEYNRNLLSLRSVLIYKNNEQLVLDQDYEFVEEFSAINITSPILVNDVIKIVDYTDTSGSFIPPTPTKLGMYPKYIPEKYVDTTYVSGPKNVIQCHDGSILLAYNDYRDDIILEYEKRVYNNIKGEYKKDLLDVLALIPNVFRQARYSNKEFIEVYQQDFIRWAGLYNIDYVTNSYFDSVNPFTWNYTGSYSEKLNKHFEGSWRAVYKNVYDTDRPHTHPWEMLGLTEKPIWWDNEYGSAPYTKNNEILWDDLEKGLIKHGPGAGINENFARPGLSKFIPVDESGNLVSPIVNLLTNITSFNIRQNWKTGDISPAENAWRRSSCWPFAVQKALALMFPSMYASLMYDPYHLNKNIANQWVYDKNSSFLDLHNLYIFSEDGQLTTGYSVYVSEIGRKRNLNYLTELRSDLAYCNFNLTHKVGGFVGKDKLQLIIDSYDPTSTSQQGLLPNENYSVILNTSNPVKSIGISGIVIQKNNGKYIVKGYDITKPYFTVYKALRNINTSAITIGGVSESYVRWTESASGGSSGLTGVDVTTANASVTGKFYKQGQIVLYGNKFYRTKVSHQSGTTFNSANFQVLPSLPTIGGATVQLVSKFDKNIEIKISYGTEFNTVQEVYDFILGYGEWLTDQGFIFDQHNVDVNNVLDWNFSAKEFLYWTTQNWVDSSVITLSPFADQIKFDSKNSIVNNFFDSFYEYSILQAGGIPLQQNKINVSRQDSICTVETLTEFDNIYFARFIAVQKEHIIVFDNTSMFNDVIYDIETGYRQRRIKFSGFRTSNWNGDYFSPGFVFDSANISDWKEYKNYNYGDIVRFSNKYYAANKNIVGTQTFDFTLWTVLSSKPESQLLPNFDYKINQFEDFYSLDIDNFDSSQQKLAQHLIGYTQRPYLNNIFTNPISQYKFYQGFIKEKGTKNSVERLAKASIKNLQGEISFTEEWAFRIGYYGGYQTSQELEIVLPEEKFIENSQIINFVDQIPTQPNDLILYTTASNVLIKPDDYSSSSVFLVNNNDFNLTTAGYVRTDDVTATAYNENSILDIANNSNIQEGNTIWLGFKSNGSWDVLKYTVQDFKVIKATVDVANLIITFVTDKHHALKAKDIVSVIQFNDQLNGVYIVEFVVNLNTFIVKTNVTPSEVDDITGAGLVFKFVSVRFNNFDSVFSDSELLNLQYGSNLWIDNIGDGTWQVLQKTKNYSEPTTSFGWSISKRSDSNIVVTGDTDYFQNGYYGRIILYKIIDSALKAQLIYSINSNNKIYYSSNAHTNFGKSLIYDDINFNNSNFGLIFAGAPYTSNIKSNSSLGGLRVASSTGTTSTYAFEGLVKISSVDPILIEETTQQVLLSPNPSSHENFGHSLYVERNSSNKLLLVGAPFSSTTGTGKVYSYRVNSSTATVNISYNSEITTSTSFSVGSQWGYAINGTDDARIVAISAPGHSLKSGCVLIYTGTNTTFLQTITSPFNNEGEFGKSIRISNNGNYLFVGAPRVLNENQSYGKVAIYSISSLTNTCTLVSILSNPVAGPGMEFGSSLDINQDENILLVSAIGTHRYVSTIFDEEDNTVFDSDSTLYSDDFPNSGVVYRYERKNSRFVLSDKIYQEATTSTNFGLSLVVESDAVYTGAYNLNGPGYLYKFTLDSSITPWNVLRKQDNLTNLSSVQKITLIDSFNERVVDYLDVIDPLKGKIASLADQELKYKSAFDPAIYSIGSSLTVNDSSSSWIDDHVGELWWDLSTVKYLWYEQGDLIYRKNNWGLLFPGATIDVYEWVGSEYLPSEWSSLADTPAGLVNGISGQPKYVDNTVVSVKQVYNPVTNSFVDRYYFWVKNKVILPNTKNRRLSGYQVASIIANPTSYGLRYAAILDANALSLTNIGPLLIADRIHLNILLDEIDNKIPRHTEWLLLEEGSSQSVPNFTLEKKLIDSLLGHDNLGNLVPDPALSERRKYGIEIRPRQTLFKNRIEALRNLIEFTNSVLEKNLITSNYNFKNLNQQESIPDEFSGEYDFIVEDNEALLIIDTRPFQRAELTCTIKDGRIRSVTVTNPGAGYKLPPKVKINDTNSTAVIDTEIDDKGKVVAAIIKDSGNGLTTAPVLEVRPHTVVVLADSLYSGKWTKFAYDYEGNWVRSSTQKYNTTLYWKYINWESDTYNPYVDYEYTIDDVYELNMLTDLLPGQYVKIKNGGDGRAIILEKTNTGVSGTFSDEYNIVFSQNGTIQLLDSLWDVRNSTLGFDQENTFDQTLFDQTPDLELQCIIKAIKEDIFVNDLKINWNLFFFKAVKYALSEQKILDWAFKTSFINVKNNAGLLDQRAVYKLQNSEYYEDYLKEVKPYHTVIRNFTTNYTFVEPTQSYTTDFDLPAVYNKTENKFDSVTLDNPIIDTYPWKSWKDNYAFSIEEIAVGFPGSGYTYPPIVQITTAPGDTGSGAEAKAFIRSGQVVYIELTKIGTGYKTAPEVLLIGGGDTKLVQAKAYARLTNKKVRTNMVGIKFDRTSKKSEIDTNTVTDIFYCNGSDNSFVLNWLAVPDKFKISVKIDQTVVLSSDYTIEYYKVTNNNYTKNYNKIIFLNFIPGTGQVLEITYVKNINLYNAVDRIINYYEPTSGMPGDDLSQLMQGIEYPKTKIEALTFDYTTKWDINYAPFDSFAWADDIGYYTKTTIANTATAGVSTLTLSTLTGIVVGQSINITSYITNKFNTTTDIIVTAINTATKVITFNSTLTGTVIPGDVIEFWSYDSNSNILDSIIDGGTWSQTTSNYYIGALGINPEDIIIQGDGFLTPNTSYAPEELIPGQIMDAVALNVYTKNPFGSPMVYSNSFFVEADVPITEKLSFIPPNKDSITVVWNGTRLYGYTTSTNFTSREQYTINWVTGEIILPSQLTEGYVGYTIVSIGGGKNDTEAGVLDVGFAVTNNETEAQVQSIASYVSVKSAYVTVDGVSISAITTTTDYGYMLSYAREDNRRAAVTVYNLPPGEHSVQAWFFANVYGYFNEVREQLFSTPGFTQSAFYLNYTPANIQPGYAQMIVEVSDDKGRRLLLPPYISYYQVTNSVNTTFSIDNKGFYPAPPVVNNSWFNFSTVKVFLNGVEMVPGFDYSISSSNRTVTIVADRISAGDVLAVVSFIRNNIADTPIIPSEKYYYDYSLNSNILSLVNGIANATLRVITFTNHDGMLIQTERFKGNVAKRYKISRPILNDRYVWVQVNGIPLTSREDYEVLDDQLTIQISDVYEHEESDEIVIMSLSSREFATTVLGYRIFNDIFNRTHFKRLSKVDTTYLTQPLYFTDTEIHVADATALTPPVPSNKVPGIVLINGERIEFLEIQGNVLKKLRRATLGTSSKFYVEVNTKVIDHSPTQTIPFTERILKQTHITTSTTNTYIISTISTSSTALNGDGIRLSTATSYTLSTGIIDRALAKTYSETALKMVVGLIPVDIAYDLNGDSQVNLNDAIDYLRLSNGVELGYTPNPTSNYNDLIIKEQVSLTPIHAVDQVMVYYGGRLLNKVGTYYADITKSYYGEDYNIIGSTATINGLQGIINPQVNDSYVVNSTNQVWIYQKSSEIDSFNGFVYKGLNYLPAEFSINTSTQALILNIRDGLKEGVKLTIIKKELDKNTLWNDEVTGSTSLPLFDSTSIQAKFIKARPAELPDNYYFGGDPAITTDSGLPLADENGNTLEGL